jgi:hypothetical protein
LQKKHTVLEGWGMSKERELLQRARDVLRGLKGTHYDLYWDIQTALDQPEQEEREVSGKIISADDACNWNLTVGALKDYDHVYVNGIRYVEFQPDINIQYLLDQVSRLTAENAMLKEKWSAPKPKPLSDEQKRLEAIAIKQREVHGIGGGE